MNQIKLIPNGYNLDVLKIDNTAEAEMRSSLKVAPDLPVIGCVARFDPQKDHNNLLQALSLLKKQGHVFKCVLVGPDMDDANSELKQWIREADCTEEVMLLGQRTDIPDLMNMFSVHVSSSAFGEAFPNVLCEAMACGTPCIATDVGDSKYITGSTGWICQPQHPQELADCISRAFKEMKNKNAWQKRCVQSRERILESFSMETMVKAYNNLWHGK